MPFHVNSFWLSNLWLMDDEIHDNSHLVVEGRRQSSARERCGFCSRSVLLTKSGNFRVHGPVSDRCHGSGTSPTVAAAPSPSSQPGDQVSGVLTLMRTHDTSCAW